MLKQRFIVSVALAAVLMGWLAQPSRPTALAASADADVPPSTTPVMTLQVSQQILTDQANAWAYGRSFGQTPLGAVTVQNVAVQLRDGQMLVSGTAKAGPTRFSAGLTATSDLRDGHIVVHVTDAQFGGISAPEPMRREVEQYIQTQVDQAVSSSGATVQSVQIGEGEMTIAVTQA